MPKFADIEKFLGSTCNYRVDIGWDYLEGCIANWSNRAGDDKTTFEMNPDFQRGHVWTGRQQIDYVEFCLRGGQSGKDIYWNHPGWSGSYIGDMVLVDGLQRVTAVQKFLKNELKVFGHYRNDYSDKLRMTDCRFVFNVNNLQNKSDVLKWYLQMNTGGVVHTDLEIFRVQKMLDDEIKMKRIADNSNYGKVTK